jgi:Leucine-rich repeat (LRR) protein
LPIIRLVAFLLPLLFSLLSMKKTISLLVLIFCLHAKAQTWVTIPDTAFVTYLHSIVPGAMQGDSLDVSNPLVTSSTQSINVRAKHISDLTGIQYFTSLTYLDCSQNTLSTLPALANSLTSLRCSNNTLTALPVLPSSLQILFADTNQLYSVPTPLPTGLVSFYVEQNNLTGLPSVMPNSIKYLFCGYNYLDSLPAALPASLIYLYCYHNQLTSLPSVLPNSIKYLACEYNGIGSLPTLPAGLLYLFCYDNQITAIPALPSSIIDLACQYNKLTALPTLPNSLLHLYCFDNHITSLPVLPTGLIDLGCDYNNLTALPALPNTLQYLYCNHNNISCFPLFPNSINPSTFNIASNPFTCLPNYIAAMGVDTLNYPLCATANVNGCAAVSGMDQITLNNEVSLYPNPADRNFTLETTAPSKQILQLFDVSGKLVLSKSIEGKTNIDVTNLSEGVYNLNLTNSTTGTINKRLIIVR